MENNITIDLDEVKRILGDWQLQVIMLQQYVKTLEEKIKQLNNEIEIIGQSDVR